MNIKIPNKTDANFIQIISNGYTYVYFPYNVQIKGELWKS